MKLPKESIDEFKQIWKKEYGQEITDAQAQEYGENLIGLFQILLDAEREEQKRKHKLLESPKGFHLSGSYTCCICHRTINNEETWYDRYGIKCLVCQNALYKKQIPKSVCKDRNSWYSSSELQSKLGFHPATIRKMIRNGQLKPRIIKGNHTPDFYIFLKNENPQLVNHLNQ